MKKNILIIEDDNLVVERYKGLLSDFDCEIDVMSTLATSTECMSRINYDLYIIDVHLKGKESGLDLIGRSGATPEKCLIISGTLGEKLVRSLIDFYKVPRENIMIKPPGSKEFKFLVNLILKIKEIPIITNENIEINAEEIMSKNISLLTDVIKKLPIKTWAYIIISIISIITSSSTFFAYRGYKAHAAFEKQVETYCISRFNYFSKGDCISTSTYTQQDIHLNDMKLIIRMYPDNFINIVLISPKFEPRHYWISDKEYIDNLGIKDGNIIDVIKSIFGGVNLPASKSK